MRSSMIWNVMRRNIYVA